MYNRHPSPALNKAFLLRPYHGVEPEKAKFLFIGLEANFHPRIEAASIFPRLLQYLTDGVQFWKQYGVHHPFLLPTYSGEGRFYHENFAAIGFKPEHAADVSFVELLHLPTYGKSLLTPGDLDRDHLIWLNQVVLHGQARHVFISGKVARLLRSTDLFRWMPQQPQPSKEALRVWVKTCEKTLYWHYHFSVYGKFRTEKLRQLQAIHALIGT